MNSAQSVRLSHLSRHAISWGLVFALLVLPFGLQHATPVTALAADAPLNLGAASSFAVLAGSTITNTGPTTISGLAGGDIGVSPGTAITGFPPGVISGVMHSADAAASQAQTALTAAYLDAAGRSTTQDLTGQDLGGLTLTPGVYSFSSSAQLTGQLTLNGLGNPDAVFIFKIGTTLTTASNSSVVFINGAQSCNVYWQVGSSATLGSGTQFKGNILALTSITLVTGAAVDGRLLARNGAVTLDSNVIRNDVCSSAATLHVIKHDINDRGGTSVASDYNVHVKSGGTDVVGSPAAGAESPGTTYTVPAGTYAVSEDASAAYTATFSGDGDANGNITLAPG
ncbi:MAG: ice-binding family protein, partial [Coriobacteriia bacterium]|nr:ice-binding family protein [Coriobacteriia bacterium]